jgi:hypothetical protein
VAAGEGLAQRSQVDMKDKWRNLEKAGAVPWRGAAAAGAAAGAAAAAGTDGDAGVGGGAGG